MITAVGCVLYQSYSRKAETEQTFKLLIDKLNGLDEGAEGESPFFVEETKVLVGFDQGQEQLNIKEDCEDWDTPIKIKKPKADTCKKEACLCICNLQTDGKKVTEETCSIASCKEIKTAAFFKGGGMCSEVFIPGRTAGGDKQGIRTLSFKIDKDILFLGEEGVSERIEGFKEQTIEGKARDVLREIYSIFSKCYTTEKEECLCGEFNYSTLPENFKIKIEDLEEAEGGATISIIYHKLIFSILDKNGAELLEKPEPLALYTFMQGGEILYKNIGLICTPTQKKNFAYGCKGVKLSSNGLEFSGSCCENLRDWTTRTKLTLIKDKEGLYLTIDPKRLSSCF